VTVATALDHAGVDPLEALGTGWTFRYLPDHVRGEEFYFPCTDDELARCLVGYHPVDIAWRTPDDSEDPLRCLTDALDGGVLPIAAVDNFHLPFRPAYHDVHAAHLLVVYGVDRARGLVWVSDAMPPAFSGALRVEDFWAAWGSMNPIDGQDAFFSDTAIGHRWLRVEVTGPFPEATPDRFGAALRSTVAAFRAPAGTMASAWTGLSGVHAYVDLLATAARAGDTAMLRQAYTHGWSLQASAYLHSELLRTRGQDWDMPAMRETARTVQSVANAWSGLRVTAAHGWPDPSGASGDVMRHGNRLGRCYDDAVAAVAALADLCGSTSSTTTEEVGP
jgi:hypothetical protein